MNIRGQKKGRQMEEKDSIDISLISKDDYVKDNWFVQGCEIKTDISSHILLHKMLEVLYGKEDR